MTAIYEIHPASRSNPDRLAMLEREREREQSARLASDLRASLLLEAARDLTACLDAYFGGEMDTGLGEARERARAAIELAERS